MINAPVCARVQETNDDESKEASDQLRNDERWDKRRAILAKVSDSVLASVTAGFAKLVDEVKKYALPM